MANTKTATRSGARGNDKENAKAKRPGIADSNKQHKATAEVKRK